MHCRNSKQAWLRSLIITALVSAIGLSLTMPVAFSGGRVAARPTVVYKTYGMDFSPYVDGQDPNLGSEISEAQLTARLQIIANNTVWARSFGCTHGLEKFGMVAHSLGLKAAVGAWLSSNTTANNQEIANLITAANAGQVDLAIVGSEVLLRNNMPEGDLIAYINQVRQQIPANIPVATADVYGKLLEHPAVIAACDVVLPNYYPYWEGVSINTSIATLHRQHQLVVAAAQGKPVIVSETGWPSAGNVICNAVPSPANASFYFLNFVSWARANNVSYFYFTSLDEAWKSNYEGPQGAHWGVWDKDGVLKPGMQDVFDGQTMADNWTNAGVPGGPGTPSMEFAYVPPYGSSNNLFGQVFHVNTDDYKVAVYIYVGGWWTKPTFANPLTNIGLDGSWECDITTGGNDPLATQIVAYLVPKTFSPPPMSGGQTLPPTLDQNAVAKTEIARSSSSPYIAGQVTDSNNQGLNCVTISLTGSQTATTHTLSNGNYSFLNLPLGGNYTVTPSHPSYTFNPSSLTFNNLASNQTGNFVALPNYTISLSASPTAGGAVSGGGTFVAGSSQTVTATANSGYAFANWMENGSVVSSSSSYTFTLNSNRNLVANFTPIQVNYTITVSASPSAGGTVSGGGTFAAGSSRTVTATANTNYTFVNWTENGSVVSSSASYTFTLNANRTLVANFTINPANDFSISATPSTQTITAGQSTSYTVNTSTTSGNAQIINLSASGLPSGATFSFNPSSVTSGGSSTLTINTASTTPTGGYTLTITGSGSTTHSTSVSLTLTAPTGSVNFALASNGGVASASSTTPADGTGTFFPSVAIDGDRKGLNTSFWRDGTGDVYPDWLQVDFAGTKTVNEIDVYTLQDNYTNPLDPNAGMTFGLYGITAFDVQYWNGSSWVTVPGGSVVGNNNVWRKFTFADITTSKIRVLVNNALASRSRIVELEAYGLPAPPSVNVALASNGGVASASSTTPPDGTGIFFPSVAIDGEHKGLNTSFWRDGTGDSYPDWLQVDFAGNKTITEIDLYTLQDNYTNPVDPAPGMTFNLYGVTAFDVQAWNDVFGWVTVPGGSVIGNNKVWRQFTFADITTSKIRVLVNNALASRSRIVELEAYGVDAATPPQVNVALQSNGAVASASSTTPPDGTGTFFPSVANDGDHKGLNISFWRDGTADTYPDWLQVDFAGSKTISEIDVYTLQDNYTNPAEPTAGMTFNLYGITAFDVQFWNGSSWVTVPGGSVTGNNNVWRKFTFPAITTNRIRVFVNNALASRSRIVELEAY